MVCQLHQWCDADQTIMKCLDHGTFIPAVAGNRHYDAVIASGQEILPADWEAGVNVVASEPDLDSDDILSSSPEAPLNEIREAYEDSYAEPRDDGAVDSDPADIDPSGDIGELVEAGSDVDPGGDSDSGGDYSAEPLAGDPEPVEEHQTEDVSPANLGGVLIQGDALATAKAMALMTVDDERFARVGDYDKAANQAKLDELRAIQQAIREGVHPPFTNEQASELQALETFLPFTQRIDDHAQGLRNAIREAVDLEQLTSIDLLNGWPE